MIYYLMGIRYYTAAAPISLPGHYLVPKRSLSHGNGILSNGSKELSHGAEIISWV
jgi:hypothetical protein